MSFKLLFPLFFLFIVSCQQEVTINEATINEINNILNKNADIQNERFLKIKREIRNELHEPEKRKYFPLLLAAKRTIESYENFQSNLKNEIEIFHLETNENSLTLKEQFILNLNSELNEIDNSFLMLFDSILINHYKQFGLRDEELEKAINHIHEEYKILQNSLTPTITDDISRDEIFQMKLKSIELAAFCNNHFFINAFREYRGGSIACNFNPFYPIILPKKNATKVGEYFEAEISIGKHYFIQAVEHPKIVVNGDTIAFAKDRIFANYKFKPTKSGEVTLKLECELIDKWTDEKYKGYSEYTVMVD